LVQEGPVPVFEVDTTLPPPPVGVDEDPDEPHYIYHVFPELDALPDVRQRPSEWAPTCGGRTYR
jgi:hypothetical protein